MRNSVMLMGTTIANSVLGYAFWVVAARTLSAHAVGLSTATISAFTLLSLLSNMGAHSVLVDLLPTRRAGVEWSRTVNAALATSGLIGVVAGVAALAVLPLIAGDFSVLRQPLYAGLFVGGVALSTWATVIDFTFVAERASGKMLLRNCAFGAVKLLLLLAVPAIGGFGASSRVVLAWVVGTLMSIAFALAVLIPRLGRAYRPQLDDLWQEIRRLSRPLVGQHLVNLGGTIPMYALPVLVTARLSATKNAYFYTTWMVGCLFFMISSWVAISLFAEGSHERGPIGARLRSSIRLVVLLTVPCMLGAIAFGHPVLRLFGPAYVSAYGLLVVLACSAIPDGITNLYVSILRLDGRLRAAAALNVGMATCTLVLAWFMLPNLGIAGGGVAWLVAETLGSAWAAIDVVRRSRGKLRRERPIMPVPAPATGADG